MFSESMSPDLLPMADAVLYMTSQNLPIDGQPSNKNQK